MAGPKPVVDLKRITFDV